MGWDDDVRGRSLGLATRLLRDFLFVVALLCVPGRVVRLRSPWAMCLTSVFPPDWDPLSRVLSGAFRAALQPRPCWRQGSLSLTAV